jgi:hypothetical protein
MPRITEDPTRAVCPSFEDPEWEFLRQSAVNAHQGDQPLTLAEAAQQMKDAWSRENQCKVVCYASLKRCPTWTKCVWMQLNDDSASVFGH